MCDCKKSPSGLFFASPARDSNSILLRAILSCHLVGDSVQQLRFRLFLENEKKVGIILAAGRLDFPCGKPSSDFFSKKSIKSELFRQIIKPKYKFKSISKKNSQKVPTKTQNSKKSRNSLCCTPCRNTRALEKFRLNCKNQRKVGTHLAARPLSRLPVCVPAYSQRAIPPA